MPFISIVIPAYNPDGHFGECLRSISGQTFRDYELIVVDDGSEVPVDLALAEGYGFPGGSLRLVRTENSGPYAARRRGIEEACGAYIMSVDADDKLIGSDALEKIAAALRATGADLLLVNVSTREDGSAPLIDYSSLVADGGTSGVAVFDPAAYRSLFASDYGYNSACSKIIRRDCVGGATAPWPRIVMADDRMLSMDCMPGIRSSAVLDEPLYFYRPAAASITHGGYRPEYYLQVCEVEGRVLAWLDGTGFDEAAWAENFLVVTCNVLLGLFYNREIAPHELEETFEMVRSQEVLARALSVGAPGRLGAYRRLQLSLLESRRYRSLRALMLLRRLGSRARAALRGRAAKGGC